jgi:hypothetical protein
MDRLAELNKLHEQLDGTTVSKKKVWIIMDKTHKIIAKGAPRSYHYLILTDDIKDRKRVLIYNSEGSARNAIISSTFAIGDGVQSYLHMKYGGDSSLKNCLDVVKATLSVKI